MRCITLLIRLVLLVTLTAQLIHGLVPDSFHTHTDENTRERTARAKDGEQQQQLSPQVQQGKEQLERTTEEDEEEENNDREYFCATQIWANKEEERRRLEQGLPDLNDEVEDYNDEDGWFLMPDS
ncbi:hypothetical protein BKA57DRAFT_522193 [Linnemannia elongata]|nr:hypothetical protein BKA57DRAFT_488958 [Linnemannia elongata]KAH7056100.1 hypothetical protein BKA57DRAFT_522193 [Linnemannia elongata]